MHLRHIQIFCKDIQVLKKKWNLTWNYMPFLFFLLIIVEVFYLLIVVIAFWTKVFLSAVKNAKKKVDVIYFFCWLVMEGIPGLMYERW